MIQRVQNLYLVLALVCLATAIFTPLGTYTFDVPGYVNGNMVLTPKSETLENATYDKDNVHLNLQEIKKYEVGEVFPMIIVNGILAALILLTIVKFKSLKAQLKINRITFIISLLVIVLLIVGVFILPSIMNEGIKSNFLLDKKILNETVTGSFSTGIAYYLYFATTAFIFLASVGIKKDISLLKSIDRIR